MSQSDPIQRIFNRMTDKITDGMIHAVLALVVMLIRPLATLTEIFFRRNMGERYFTAWNVIAGWWIITAFTAFRLGVPMPSNAGYDEMGRYQPGQSATPLLVWFFGSAAWSFCLFAAMGVQQFFVRQRYKQGGRWHSRSIGEPWFPLLPAWAEKAIPIVAGIYIAWYCHVPLLGALLILSGITSGLLRLHEARLFRERVLDVIDSQIEQEYLAKAVLERSKPNEVDGLRAPLPAYVSQKFRERFVEALTPADSVGLQSPAPQPSAPPPPPPTPVPPAPVPPPAPQKQNSAPQGNSWYQKP